MKHSRKRVHEGLRWLGALAATGMLLVAFAAPSLAAKSDTTLSAATVSPRTGTTSTTVKITVVYQNDGGSRAEHVDALVGAVAHEMTRQAGGDWGHGVNFSWSGTLPVGVHAITITARAKDHSEATLAAGVVTITTVPVPTPTPKPTPTPTPRSTPRPTPTPTPRATPRPTAKPTATPTAAPNEAATPPAQPTPTATATATTTPDPTEAPTPTPTSSEAAIIGDPVASTGPGGTGPGGPTGGGTDIPTGPAGPLADGHPQGWGPVAGLLAMAGLQGPTFPAFGLGPTLVTTTGAVAAAMAFGLFGRRRRDDDPPDDLMAAAAARGLGDAPLVFAGAGSAGSGPESAEPAATPAADAATEPEEIEDAEASMPRWRRPSLLQARRADPIRDNVPAPRLTFDQGLVGPLGGPERRVIRYRVVRLLDSPDELRGVEIGYLDQGDEVQLIEKYGAYWLVRSPDGQQGWLHKMVLGELVDPDAPPMFEGPVATMPIAAESWTMGESDVDGDVFDSYLESRRRDG